MDYPHVNYKEKKMYQIGCKNCKNGNWRIYTDGKNFIAKCRKCDHAIELIDKSLVNKPEI